MAKKINISGNSNLSHQINNLFKRQILNWPLTKQNYGGLNEVRTRVFEFDEFEVKVQFNPRRILSTSAKVDRKSIQERPCFLCTHHLPGEQEIVQFDEDYQLLVNPYPIFSKHLTIPTYQHRPQNIRNDFGAFLNIINQLPDFVVFYNGPKCGASAPDHMHFQASIKGFLPLEKDYQKGKNVQLHSEKKKIKISYWRNYLRTIISFESEKVDELKNILESCYNEFVKGLTEEPMINLLGYTSSDKFVIHWIPRRVHRSTHYFKNGDEQFLISPASVDMSGIIITPREEDFNKITRKDIEDIYAEVCMPDEEIFPILNKLVK